MTLQDKLNEVESRRQKLLQGGEVERQHKMANLGNPY